MSLWQMIFGWKFHFAFSTYVRMEMCVWVVRHIFFTLLDFVTIHFFVALLFCVVRKHRRKVHGIAKMDECKFMAASSKY